MKATERLGFTAVHILVGGTGLVYFYMEYFMETDDPFALVNHPWQSPTLSLHVVAAPVFIVLFGMMLRSHSLPKLRRGQPTNRRTGWFSLLSFGVMALSGYFIQITTTPILMTVWSWTHIVSGCVFVLAFGFHFVIGWPIGRAIRERLSGWTAR